MFEQRHLNTVLTPRQTDVVRLVALEYSDKEIAVQLGIAVETVKRHVRDARIRLNVRSRVGIAIYAAEKRLLRQPGIADEIVGP